MHSSNKIFIASHVLFDEISFPYSSYSKFLTSFITVIFNLILFQFLIAIKKPLKLALQKMKLNLIILMIILHLTFTTQPLMLHLHKYTLNLLPYLPHIHNHYYPPHPHNSHHLLIYPL